MLSSARALQTAGAARCPILDHPWMVEAVEMVQVEKARVVVVPVAEVASALAMVNHEELEEED